MAQSQTYVRVQAKTADDKNALGISSGITGSTSFGVTIRWVNPGGISGDVPLGLGAWTGPDGTDFYAEVASASTADEISNIVFRYWNNVGAYTAINTLRDCAILGLS